MCEKGAFPMRVPSPSLWEKISLLVLYGMNKGITIWGCEQNQLWTRHWRGIWFHALWEHFWNSNWKWYIVLQFRKYSSIWRQPKNACVYCYMVSISKNVTYLEFQILVCGGPNETGMTAAVNVPDLGWPVIWDRLSGPSSCLNRVGGVANLSNRKDLPK